MNDGDTDTRADAEVDAADDRATSSAELARSLEAEHHGRARRVQRLVSPSSPGPGGVAVLPDPDPEHLQALTTAGLSALVVARSAVTHETSAAADRAGLALLVVDDPRLAFARLSERFDPRPPPAPPGVDARAAVHPGARLGDGVSIGAFTVVADGAVVGDGVVVGNRCTIGAGTRVGGGSVLFDGVVLYDGVTLGRRVRVHAGAVIGADGFGYALSPQGAVKIHHLGGVVIGDDVEIGALTAIDRGTIEPTRVGDRTKIDNFCQIAHNVVIGSDTVIAGQTGLAGSCRIGDRVVMGGACSVADHVTVGDDVRLAGRSGVSKDVPPGATWAGIPAQPHRKWIRERYLINNLETIWSVVRSLRKPT